MRKSQHLLFLHVIAIFICSCGRDPYALRIPLNPKDWPTSKDLVSTLEKLPTEERILVSSYLNAQSKKSLYTGPDTIGELLAQLSKQKRDLKEFTAGVLERDKLSEKGLSAEAPLHEIPTTKEERKQSEDSAKLSDFFKTKVISSEIRLGSENFSDKVLNNFQYAYLNVEFENTHKLGFIESRGVLDLRDQFGRVIESKELLLDFQIPPKEKRTIRIAFVKPMKPEHLSSVENITSVWTPHAFLLETGEMLTDPGAPPLWPATNRETITKPLP